ncbi:UNVERIFIED_CONTAM: hypothetical protein FKN15_044757 [Acipenser sinensis]
MPSKTTKSSTAAKPKGKGVASLDDSSDEMEIPPQKINTNGKEAARSKDVTPDVTDEAVDNRSLEEILSSIPPPPPPAMTNEPGAPRLMITHIVNQNFKSYADEQVLGPFHKSSPMVFTPGGARPVVRRSLGTPGHGQTCNLQATGRILHSMQSAFTGCATQEPPLKCSF